MHPKRPKLGPIHLNPASEMIFLITFLELSLSDNYNSYRNLMCDLYLLTCLALYREKSSRQWEYRRSLGFRQ